MNITDVKIFPVREAKLKAYVSIVLDQAFMVNDLKIIQGREGLFISMPSRRRRNGTYRDIAHPLNSETRQVLQDRVLSAYHEVVAGDDGDAVERTEPAAGQVVATPEPPTPGARAGLAVQPLSPAPAEVRAEPGAPAGPQQGNDGDGGEDEQSLQEVEEAHLSDSFWTVS